jgi:hypothetical protein
MAITSAPRLARTAWRRPLLLVLAGAVLLGVALATWMTVATAEPAPTTATTTAVERTAPEDFYRDGRQAPQILPLPPRPHGRTPLMG